MRIPARRLPLFRQLPLSEFLEADRQVAEVRLVFFSSSDAKVFLRSHKFNRAALT